MLNLSRAKANEILDLWKSGAASFAQDVINLALYVTGDLGSYRED